MVAVASASAGVIPALTNQASSPVFSPKPVNTASDPIPSLTPARYARRAVSKFRWTKARRFRSFSSVYPNSSR